MVAAVLFTGGRFNRQIDRLQGVMRTTHATFGRRSFILWDCHNYS